MYKWWDSMDGTQLTWLPRLFFTQNFCMLILMQNSVNGHKKIHLEVFSKIFNIFGILHVNLEKNGYYLQHLHNIDIVFQISFKGCHCWKDLLFASAHKNPSHGSCNYQTRDHWCRSKHISWQWNHCKVSTAIESINTFLFLVRCQF